MEHTESSASSPEAKMFRRCFVMAGRFTPNSSASAFCVSQTVSSLKKHVHLHRPVRRGVEDEIAARRRGKIGR